MNCRICSTELIKSDLEDFYYCPHCNKKFKISSIKKCKSCSTPLKKCEDDTWFCPSCGKRYRFSAVKKDNPVDSKVEEKPETAVTTVSPSEEEHAATSISLKIDTSDEKIDLTGKADTVSITAPPKEDTETKEPLDTPGEEKPHSAPIDVSELGHGIDEVPEKDSTSDTLPNLDDVIEPEIVDNTKENPIGIDDLLEEAIVKDDEALLSVSDIIEEDISATTEAEVKKIDEHKIESEKSEGKEKKSDTSTPHVVIRLAEDEANAKDEPEEITSKKGEIRVATLEELSAATKKSKGNTHGGKASKTIGIIAGILALLIGIIHMTLILYQGLPYNIYDIILDIYVYTPMIVWGMGIIISIILLINLKGGQKAAGIGYLIASIYGVAYDAYVCYGNALEYEEKVAFFNELYKHSELLVFIPIALVFIAGTFTLILMDKSNRNSKRAGIAGIIAAILAALAEAAELLPYKTGFGVPYLSLYPIKYALLGLAFLLLVIITPKKE